MPNAWSIILVVIGVWLLLLYLWALIDVIRRRFDPGHLKWVWLAIVLFTYPIGLVVYLLVVHARAKPA